MPKMSFEGAEVCESLANILAIGGGCLGGLGREERREDMRIEKEEFDKLGNIVCWLNTMVDSCIDLLDYIDDEIDFREELSHWVIEWLKRVEQVCEEVQESVGRVVDQASDFLIMARRPWRAGEDDDWVKCSGCGEAQDRRFVIRKWEGDEEVILCLRCAGVE
jgi:hypothetical protein